MDHCDAEAYRSCAVPLCQNTSISTPKKLFILVPFNIKRRNLWLRLAKRNPKKVASDMKIYFCEDHFDLETDMSNCVQYKKGLTKKVEMMPGCIPTKFKCQMNHRMTPKSQNIVIPITKKILLDLTEEQKRQSEATTSMTQSTTEMKCSDVDSSNIQKQKSDSGIPGNLDQFQKVFLSDIPKSNYIPSNNLYDLLKIVPAAPVEVTEPQSGTWDFVPNTDKYYIPKKKSRLKVRTVRNIRKELEQDVYSYLPKALENQNASLLKKIIDGSSRGANTKLLAKKMLNSDHPLLRSSWQMLMNINPENHQHSKQFVLWNGKCIQINGSKGGRNKFICNYDLGSPILKQVPAKRMPKKKKGLLQNSLAIKFKPGPLRRKKYLDDSYQKYHVGNTELISLPQPGLDIQPFYGMTLEPGIAKFVNSLREENGKICGTWAEFAVTMLGSIKKANAVQHNPGTIITFDLNYKYNQHKMLMRQDIQDRPGALKVQNENDFAPSYVLNESIIKSKIEGMLEKMLDSVEIGLEQENIYSGEDEPRETICDGPLNMYNIKDKPKKRTCELGRLDVTVIRLPEDNLTIKQKNCNKPFCTLGCVCASLECSYNLKPHCGLIGCMFQCVCDFSRYMDTNILKSECSDLIPSLIELDTKINLNLTKEEQKFHQTVILSGENSILLKKQKRNLKASKKYADFYTNLNLKASKKAEMVLSVVGLNLNCKNIEPWCMIHNLYKCFCKGKFTETSIFDHNEDNVQNVVTVEIPPFTTSTLGLNEDVNINSYTDKTMTVETNTNIDTHLLNSSCDEDKYSSARVKIYKGRKYSDGYYKNINNKIKKIEQNDTKLKKKLTCIINNYGIECKSSLQCRPILDSTTIVDVESSTFDKSTSLGQTLSQAEKAQDESVNKLKLVAWLESSYKLYKQRMSQGIIKTSLEPPVSGKLALYTWEFILKRYKQRKNFFMVNKQAPFRIFIAVDGKNSFFDNCININNIELADLHKFPISVKNLLTNACDSEEDFCILCGWNDCWEIIGSVSKLNDKCETNMVDENVFNSDFFPTKTMLKDMECKNKLLTNTQSTVNLKRRLSSDSSKWFVMTVENDFNEIQFHTRGFFVTYSSIRKAINVARRTGKTVRLSSQKCAERGNGPQFGIYAIPDAKEFCVFVGPYEMHEPLGIETVMNTLHVTNDKKTRGVWITTDKVDNGKVIDNPLSYMPFSHIEKNDMFDLNTNNDSIGSANTEYSGCSFSQSNLQQMETSSEDSDVAKTPTKCLKPIKIRKTQNFYHIASNGALKNIFYKTSKKQNEPNVPPSFLSTCDQHTGDIMTNSSSLDNNEGDNLLENLNDVTSISQPETETKAPVKATAVYSRKKNEIQSKKPDRGMFILKPEEINRRLFENKLDQTELLVNPQNDDSEKKNIDMDIENFLSNSVVCTSPESEILEISDDTDDENLEQFVHKRKSSEVWIQCTNIDDFGWIKGKKNDKGLLSFEFPGFKPTDFYETQEAFLKINQVLSRMIYISKNFTLEWEVIDCESKLRHTDKLNAEQLGPAYVLTKQGIKHKQDLLRSKSSNIKHIHSTITEKVVPTCTPSTSKVTYTAGLKNQSVILENEDNLLWNNIVTNKATILKTLTSACEETKQYMTDKLKTIKSINKH